MLVCASDEGKITVAGSMKNLAQVWWTTMEKRTWISKLIKLFYQFFRNLIVQVSSSMLHKYVPVWLYKIPKLL